MSIEVFTNDNYKLLNVLYDNQSKVLDKTIVPLTQEEISQILGMSKAKINSMFISLQKLGFISQEARGKYSILKKGKTLVEDLKKLESRLSKDSH